MLSLHIISSCFDDSEVPPGHCWKPVMGLWVTKSLCSKTTARNWGVLRQHPSYTPQGAALCLGPRVANPDMGRFPGLKVCTLSK